MARFVCNASRHCVQEYYSSVSSYTVAKWALIATGSVVRCVTSPGDALDFGRFQSFQTARPGNRDSSSTDIHLSL